MKRSIVLMLVLAGVLTLTGALRADVPPWFEYVIAYDGYVERHTTGGMPFFSADTLFVINNTHPSDMLDLWFEIYDKHGLLLWEGEVWDGGMPIPQVVPNGFGWITLGMILNMINRDTFDPFGGPAAEKFYVRISGAHRNSPLKMVPTVEVKQVLYYNDVDMPEFHIWQPWLIRSWAETGLGGNKHATGVIWPQ